MNAQASWLWFEQLGKALHAKLGLPFSVEVRPIHLQVQLGDDASFAIGDANGPVGLDLSTSKGEVVGACFESSTYVGDAIEPLATELADRMLTSLWEQCEDVRDEQNGKLDILVFGAELSLRARYCSCRGFVRAELGPCTNKACGSDLPLSADYCSRLYCAACNEPIMGEARRDKAGFPYHNSLGCFKPMLGGN